MTAPHAGILIGLVMILGAAVVGTLVAPFERVDGIHLGALRVPRSLEPLWALGLGAASGFPLDEEWHTEYGIAVTVRSPPHMLLIFRAPCTAMDAYRTLPPYGCPAPARSWTPGATTG